MKNCKNNVKLIMKNCKNNVLDRWAQGQFGTSLGRKGNEKGS